jgi:hypothetical protein
MRFLTSANWFCRVIIPCLFKGRVDWKGGHIYNCWYQIQHRTPVGAWYSTHTLKFCCLKVLFHPPIHGQLATIYYCRIYKYASVLFRNVRALWGTLTIDSYIILSDWISHWDYACMNNNVIPKRAVEETESEESMPPTGATFRLRPH